MKSSALKMFAALITVASAALPLQAYDIYSNTNAAADLNFNFSPGTMKIGDEIVPVTGGFLQHIDIQYYLTNSSGNETVQLWLYQNDGTGITLINRTAYEPSTVLFNSGPFNIGSFGDTVRSTLNYDAGVDFAANSIFITGTLNLTLAIQFGGIESGEDAGVSLYDFPTVGGNYNSYWEYNGSTWSLATNASPSGYIDFGMRIEAVPEPSVLSLLGLGGLALFGFRRMFTRK